MPVVGPIVVMGVAGSGKTVVGRALAHRLGVAFVDADDLHPPANVAKMSGGTPLDDHDRAPWLDEVGRTLAADPAPVVACSALKRAYRDRLRRFAPATRFLLLDGERSLVADRMAARADHFMPTSLLDDQLATLERPAVDEEARTISIEQPVERVVADALDWLWR